MNLYNLPQPIDVVTFNRGTHEFYLPKYIINCFVVLINGGGGGGAGFSRSSGSGGGGAGGVNGSVTSCFLPPFMIPKGMRVIVGTGGIGGVAGSSAATSGGSSGLYSLAQTSVIQAYCSSGNNAGNAGTVSAGGTAGGYADVGVNPTLDQGTYDYGLVPGISNIAGNITATVDHTYGVSANWTKQWNQSGHGGGGVTVGGTPLNGNGYTVDVTSPFMPGTVSPGGTGSSVAAGGNGLNGITIYDPISKVIPIATGGTGGGASTFGTGGRGGRGGIGSGGGGGGSGITGGSGGDGGDGLVILVLW